MYQKYFIGCSYNHQKYVLAQKIAVVTGNRSMMNILVVILCGLQKTFSLFLLYNLKFPQIF